MPATAFQALPAQAGKDGDQAPNQRDADNGKAPMPPTFIVNYNLDTSFREATIILRMCIKTTDQALQDRRLVEELMKIVMLSAD